METLCAALGLLLVLWCASETNGVCTEMANCETCKNPGLLCYDCPQRKALLQDQSGCLDCMLNCAVCEAVSSTDTKCTTCDAGYLKKSDGTCQKCLDNCISCRFDGADMKCDGCENPDSSGVYHFLAGNEAACYACPSKCTSCSLTDAGVLLSCSSCVASYALSTSTSTCKACPQFCSVCVEGSTGGIECTVCNAGYLVDTANPSQCQKCSANCAACTTVSVCDTCDPYFRVESGACVACPDRCKTCSVNSEGQDECSKCDEGWGIKGPVITTCDACGANCDVCTSSDVCVDCKVEFTVDNNGICKACPNGCNECTYNTGTGATQCSSGSCKSGFVRNSADGLCSACPSGCSDSQCQYSVGLSSAICTLCDGAAIDALNSDDGTCVACPADCLSCTYNDTLSPPSTTCDTCGVGYGIDSDGISCAVCPDCDYCVYNGSTSAMECTCSDGADPSTPDQNGPCTVGNPVCASGTYFNQFGGASGNSICSACSVGSGCDICDSQFLCVSCLSGYTSSPTNGICSACPGLCSACSFDGSGSVVCDTCIEGYGLKDDKSDCIPCQTINCEECTVEKSKGKGSSTKTECTKCKTGFALKVPPNTKCIACPSLCDSCSVTTGTKATCDSGSCRSRSAPNPTDGTCHECPPDCTACTYDSSTSSTHCTTCLPQYAVRGDTFICEKCPLHCGTCSYDGVTSEVLCNSNADCAEGYGIKSDGLCYACPSGCKQCTEDVDSGDLICDTCVSIFFKNEKPCGACPSGCKSCTEAQGAMVCSECNAQYVMDSSGTCRECPPRCKKCIISASGVVQCKADECENGFGRSSDGTACIYCAYLTGIIHCVLCDDRPAPGVLSNCSHCAEGYSFSEDLTQCIDHTVTLKGCEVAKDLPWQCSQCSDGYHLTNSSRCAISCYTCSGHEDECNSKKAAYDTVDCFGRCWASSEAVIDGIHVNYDRGCDPGLAEEIPCADEESCVDTLFHFDKLCVRCCDTDKCNDFIMKGGGQLITPRLPNMTPILLILLANSIQW